MTDKLLHRALLSIQKPDVSGSSNITFIARILLCVIRQISNGIVDTTIILKRENRHYCVNIC
jgi:hypothetical protein